MTNTFRTLTAIERIGRLDSIAGIERELGAALSNIGFSYFCLLGLPTQTPGAAPLFMLDTTPAGWRETYEDERFYEHDHIVQFGKSARESFPFRNVPCPPNDAARRLLSVLESFGMPNGLIVPLQPVCDKPSGACLTGPDIDTGALATRDAEILMFYAACRLREMFNRDTAIFSRRLSPREREVLQWAANGKTSEETGDILRKNGHEIDKVVFAAMAKLDAVSKLQAVAIAIHNREIDL